MNLAAALDRAVTHHAGRPAVVDGDRRLTYLELYRRAEALARRLDDAGLRAGDRVACVSENRVEMIELLYACAKRGLTCVFLNYRLSPAEIDWILRDCEPAFVVHEAQYRPAAFLEQADRLGGALSFDAGQPEPLYEDALDGAAVDAVPWSGDLDVDSGETPLLILYTSGTTGLPKGALHTHRSMLSTLLGVQAHMAYAPADVALAMLPLCHVASLQLHALPILLCGGRLVIARRFTPEPIADLLAGEGVTATLLLVQQWADVERVCLQRGVTLDRLRWLLTGSQPTPPSQVEAMRRLAPSGQYVLIYGMTEVGTFATLLDNESMESRNASIGRPTVLASVGVVDDAGRPVAVGDVGEIVHRGPGLCSGYWNRPEATEAAMSDSWFRSGDLARRDEHGYLYIVDRKKDMIKSGGENVYSLEVENALRSHPAVGDVAVVGVQDGRWGEMVKAFVVARAAVSEHDLREHCAGRIAGYKKPKVVEFVGALPRSGTGKVDKGLLRTGGAWPGKEDDPRD